MALLANRWVGLGWGAAAVAALASGCAEDNLLFSDGGATVGAGGNGSSSSSSGEGGDSSTTSTTSSVGGAGGSGAAGGMGGGSGGQGGDMCMPTSSAGVSFRDLDMVIIVDRSGSMDVNNKLNQVKTGINTFASAPKNSNTYVSLLYQPREQQNEQCNPDAYNPPDLQRAQVPAGATVVQTSLNPVQSNGPSPWAAPLTGGIAYAATVHNQLPQGDAVTVFMVDTPPNFCQETQQATAAINVATQGLAAGIRTYAMGLDGVNMTVLDQLAAAGGTNAAVDLTTNLANLAVELEGVRSRAIRCELPMPPLPTNINRDQVNLRYTPGGNGTPEVIPRVNDANGCGNGAGWYYDSPNSTALMVLCPASCNTIKADVAFLAEALFGCATVTR